MIKSIVKLALVLIVGILVYNNFFGTSEEKAQAKEVFSSVKGVVKSVAGIVRSEKDKFDAGKYDKVMEKLGGAYSKVREQAAFLDDKELKRLSDLEERKKALEAELSDLDQEEKEDAKTLVRDKDESTTSAKAASKKDRQAKLQREMEKLLQESEKLLQDAEDSQK